VRGGRPPESHSHERVAKAMPCRANKTKECNKTKSVDKILWKFSIPRTDRDPPIAEARVGGRNRNTFRFFRSEDENVAEVVEWV